MVVVGFILGGVSPEASESTAESVCVSFGDFLHFRTALAKAAVDRRRDRHATCHLPPLDALSRFTFTVSRYDGMTDDGSEFIVKVSRYHDPMR